MTNIPEEMLSGVINGYEPDDTTLSLALSVYYWGHVGANPNTTPPKVGAIVETAQVFYKYLTTEYH
jgi:hypothetical protein